MGILHKCFYRLYFILFPSWKRNILRSSNFHKMKLLVALLTVLVSHIATGQHALKSFKNNKEFDWVVDSSLMQLTIYYKKDGWAADRIASIKPKLVDQIKSTEQFMGIDSYTKDINYFIVDSRSEMVDLTGRETNGSAF